MAVGTVRAAPTWQLSASSTAVMVVCQVADEAAFLQMRDSIAQQIGWCSMAVLVQRLLQVMVLTIRDSS